MLTQGPGLVAPTARCGPHGRLWRRSQQSCTDASEADGPRNGRDRFPKTFTMTAPLHRTPSKGNLLIFSSGGSRALCPELSPGRAGSELRLLGMVCGKGAQGLRQRPSQDGEVHTRVQGKGRPRPRGTICFHHPPASLPISPA